MFSDEELEAAVLKYLTSTVTTARTDAGTRNIAATKTQVYEIISSAFLLRPSALFSVCWLASNNLRSLIAEQLVDMRDIVDAAPRVSKVSQRVGKTTDLYNAEASLVSLTAVFAARRTGIAGGIGPAVQRFEASIDRFVRGELTKNVVSAGEIVRTPEELRELMAERWAVARVRHLEIVLAADNLAGALDNFVNVRLPDTVVGTLLVRIRERLSVLTEQMEASGAARDSRNALLELSAMRTLLKQAAAFKPPALKKAPLTGDATGGQLLGATGLPSSVLGTVSGPFNYAPGTQLAYSIAGQAAVLPLPGSSVAELRSRAMAPYVPPPVDAVCTVRLADALVELPAAAWVNGPTAASALGTLGGVAARWDSVTEQLVFQTDDDGDGARLEFLTDTADRYAFVTWLLGPGASRLAVGTPVPVEDVIAAFAQDGRIRAERVRELGEDFVGQRSSDPAKENVLLHRVYAATDLAGDGTAAARASVDLEAMGVEAGMYLRLTAPVDLFRRIEAVAGPVLVLDSAVAEGLHSYYIASSFEGVEPGTRVTLVGTADAGPYRILASSMGELVLDRALTSTESVRVVGMTSDLLRLSARDVGPAVTLEVMAGEGATALGLVPGLLKPSLDTFDAGVDVAARGVVVGDKLVLERDVRSWALTIVACSGTTVRFEPPIPYEAGTYTYSIRDAVVQDYMSLRGSLLLSAAQPPFTGEARVDEVVGRLQRGARYSLDFNDVLAGYVAALAELEAICDAYVVARDATVEQAVRLMVEHGFDRAVDLFLALRLPEFFTLDADGVSYKTWVIRNVQEVTRTVLPVSKDQRDPTSMFQTIAVQRNPAGS